MVLQREEKRGDIIGFYHTHPTGFVNPSQRDCLTMNDWSFCFGKPLLCAIATTAGLKVWLFDHSSDPIEVKYTAIFKSRWLVAVLKQD